MDSDGRLERHTSSWLVRTLVASSRSGIQIPRHLHVLCSIVVEIYVGVVQFVFSWSLWSRVFFVPDSLVT